MSGKTEIIFTFPFFDYFFDKQYEQKINYAYYNSRSAAP